MFSNIIIFNKKNINLIKKISKKYTKLSSHNKSKILIKKKGTIQTKHKTNTDTDSDTDSDDTDTDEKDILFIETFESSFKNWYTEKLYPALFDTEYNKYNENCRFSPYRTYPYTRYVNVPFFKRFDDWRNENIKKVRSDPNGFNKTKYWYFKNKYYYLRRKYDYKYLSKRREEFFKYKKQKRLAYERYLNKDKIAKERQLFDPVLNLRQYTKNMYKLYLKNNFFKNNVKGTILGKYLFKRYNFLYNIFFLYYYGKYTFEKTFKPIKYKKWSKNKSSLYYNSNSSLNFNFFYPKRIKSFIMEKKKNFLKIMNMNEFSWYWIYFNRYKKYHFQYKLDDMKFNYFYKLAFNENKTLYNYKSYKDIRKKHQKSLLDLFFFYFSKYQFKLLFYRRNYNSYIYYNWLNKRWLKHSDYWKKINIKRGKRNDYWFSYNKYIYQYFYLMNQPELMKSWKKTGVTKHKKFKFSWSWIVKKRIIKKKKGRLRFVGYSKRYLYKKKKYKKLFTSFWKTNVFFLKSRRRYFYFLENFKKYYDAFYIIDRFLNWYNPYLDKSNNLIDMSFQHQKYTRFTHLYNSYFEHNYKNILSILNCYFINNNITNNKKPMPLIHSHSNIKKFLFRRKRLFKINFFYRLFLKKKKLKYFNYYYNKTLYDFKKSSFYNDKNFISTSYVNDVSLLFNDHIMNWNYINKVDEKMHFYLKHLFFNKLSNKMNIKLKKENVLFKLTHLLNFQHQYLTYYKKFYMCLGIHLYINNNIKQTIFYSYLLTKYNIFIIKNPWFYFFKEYIVHRLKSFLYNYKLNKSFFKKGIKTSLRNENVEINWLDLFAFPIKEFDDHEYYGRKEMYSYIHYMCLSNLNSFFKMNSLDWFYFLCKILKKKKKYNDIGNFRLKSQKKLNSVKNKFILKYFKNLIFNSNNIRINFYILNSFLKYKYSPHYKKFFIKKDKWNLLSLYKIYLYDLVKDFVKWFKRNEFLFMTGKKYRTKKYKNWLKQYIHIKGLSKLYNKHQDVYFYKKFISLCNNFFNKSRYNKNYYFRKYFEIYNDLYTYKYKLKSKKKKNKKNVFSKLWNSFLKNKKISIYFIVTCVEYLYKLKHHFNKNVHFFKSFLNYYYLIRFFKFKEKQFNFFFSIHNKEKKKLKYKSTHFNTIKSFVVPKKRKHFFMLSSHYNVFMVFFFFFKKTIIEQVINNSFIIYNNKILFYNIKNNFIFLKNKYYQYDYLINNFLNEEIETLIK